MAEWYELSFGEDYLLVYKHRDAQGAQHEVQRMIRWLHLPAGAKVLDLCCGMGRHSLALAEAGYQVTGVDLSEVLLREARRLDSEGRITWQRADMRKLPLPSRFSESRLCCRPSCSVFGTGGRRAANCRTAAD